MHEKNIEELFTLLDEALEGKLSNNFQKKDEIKKSIKKHIESMELELDLFPFMIMAVFETSLDGMQTLAKISEEGKDCSLSLMKNFKRLIQETQEKVRALDA